MDTQYHVQLLRSKLISMTRLTQRTVDYSIKGFQLGRPELCGEVRNSQDEMSAIHRRIARGGRALLATKFASDSDARFVCSALRISTALRASCALASEIAQNTLVRFTSEHGPVSKALEEAGQFVNSLLRLCIVALFKREAQHAMTVLQTCSAGPRFDLAVRLAHENLAARASSHARYELSISRSLGQIAEQACEIADATALWLGEMPCIDAKRLRAANGWQAGPESQLGKQADISETANTRWFKLCSVLEESGHGAWESRGANHPRQRQFSRKHDIQLNSAQNATIVSFAETRPPASEDVNDEHWQARLTVLQHRVCELLVKNEQLRMALMAERANRTGEECSSTP